jgi:multiple sugar transport system ATP-binding protein
MTLADRIVVMNDRQIQQVGAPMDIYARPANIFVARFVGSPAMTVAPAELVDGGGQYAVVRLGNGATVETRIARSSMPSEKTLQLGIRPEHVRVVSEQGHSAAKVELVERLGERTLIYARLEDGLQITAEDSGFSKIKMGDEIALRINGDAVHLFGPDGRGYHAEPQAA